MLGLLLAVEAVTRVKLFRVSKDFRDFLSYPGRAAALAGCEGLRVAVLGNSVAHEGIAPAVLAEAIAARAGRPAHTDVFSVDRSYVNTWYFVLERYFWTPANRVDLVLVPFWGDNLYDGNPLETGRLAQFFTTVADWPGIVRLDLSTASERADFLVSGVWATFAARDRMQQWVFTHALGSYREFALREQSVALDHQVLANAGRPRIVRAARGLRRLLRTAREHGTRVCFVAVPTLHPEWDDHYVRLVRLMHRAGMTYVDLRQMAGLTPRSYVDRVHMNEAGREVFSRRLGEVLGDALRGAGTTPLTGAEAGPVAADSGGASS